MPNRGLGRITRGNEHHTFLLIGMEQQHRPDLGIKIAADGPRGIDLTEFDDSDLDQLRILLARDQLEEGEIQRPDQNSGGVVCRLTQSNVRNRLCVVFSLAGGGLNHDQ